MKRYLLMLAIAVGLTAHGQEYKVAKATGKLEIRDLNRVRIEGYAGNEIVFVREGGNRDKDDRAAGLRAVNALGLEDNTGLGLSVLDKAGVIEVRQLKKMDGPHIVIKVPKGVTVSYSHSSPYGSDVLLSNLEGAIEASTVHSDLMLDNVKGPVTIKTVHGDVDVKLAANITNPITIASVHGHVDVAMPVATKASMKMSTSWGELFIDPDFKMQIDETGGMMKYSDKLNGTINGGGIDMTLSSTHDNVYLRKY